MNARIAQWSERYDALSFRERSLVFAAIVVVLFMIWDNALLQPQQLKQKKYVSQMQGLNQQLEILNDKVTTMSEELHGGESRRVQNRIIELHSLLSGLERKQENLTVEFIRPAQMAKVLRDMLNNESKLSLTRLESLGVKPLFPPVEHNGVANDSSQVAQANQPNIYKHAMRVIFEGDFNSTLHYLRALESMPWRFYWDNVEYQVLEYPVARVIISVHTLSLHKGWIGV